MRSRYTLFVILMFFSFHAWGESKSVELRQPPNIGIVAAPHFNSVAHHVEAALLASPNLHPNLTRYSLDEVDKGHYKPVGPTALTIAIGPKALKAILNTKTASPILAIMVRKNVILDTLKTHKKENPHHPALLSAVYLDQPYYRQLLLTQELLQEIKPPLNVGVVLGPSTRDDESILQGAADRLGIHLKIAHVGEGEDPIHALTTVLADSHVLLSVPDEGVINQHSARGLLLTAYRRQVPLIGYSRAFINLGALAGIYSNPKNIGIQVATMARHYFSSEPLMLPKPEFPSEFSVEINQQVSKHLNLPQKDTIDVTQVIARKEQERATVRRVL